MRRTAIKFCGCRTETDVENAVRTGADAIGFVFAASSRRLSYAEAANLLKIVPSGIVPVAVVSEPTEDDIRRLRQLRGDITLQISTPMNSASALPRESIIQTIHIDADSTTKSIERMLAGVRADIVLFDTSVRGKLGGTGRPFPWKVVQPYVCRRRSFIAGGLTAENVAKCVRLLRPFGVDVSSGIETDGRKDAMKMRRFAEAVKWADEN